MQPAMHGSHPSTHTLHPVDNYQIKIQAVLCPDHFWNNNGTQLTKTVGSVTTTYGWDLQGHLVSIDNTTDQTVDVTYAYNSDGVRVAETADGTTTYYLNDPQNPTGYTKAIEDRSDTNSDGVADTTNKSYILGTQIIGQVSSTATYYLLVDGHGSTRALTSTTGGIVENYDFDAYGIALNFDPNTAMTNWLFGGDGLWDPNSLFTYHLARFRDAERFISYDIFEADPTTPASLHKYLYASNNSTNRIDPSGHLTTLETVTVAGLLLLQGSMYLGAIVATGILGGTIGKMIARPFFPSGIRISAMSVPALDKEFAQLAADVYNPTPSTELPCWRPVQPNTIPGLEDAVFRSGSFHAELYRSTSTQGYALVFEGTGDWKDWYSSIGQGALGPIFSTQYHDATRLAVLVRKALGPHTLLTMVGHSLGGGLADAAALATNCPAVTFNAAGLNFATELHYGAGSYTSSLANYRINGEALSTANDYIGLVPGVPGGNFILDSAEADRKADPATLHKMSAVLNALGL